MEEEKKIRIDKWLWAARFFKTRSMAAKAVSGGHVHLNSARVKPARAVSVGDELRIVRNETEFIITVKQLLEKRGPATLARTLYEETEESIAAREMTREQKKMMHMGHVSPAKRPGKKDRRLIRSFTRKTE